MYEQIEAYIRSLMASSLPEAPAWNIEKLRRGAPPAWNYIDGCMLTALLALWEITGDEAYFRFVERFADFYVAEDGALRGYERDTFNLDNINEGRILFPLYRRTGKEKYRRAIERLANQLRLQPRTPEGNFWHKAIYPNQIWLDGVYMAQPFLALYERTFGTGDAADTARQVANVRRLMRDGKTGLYFHACDTSRNAFWADKDTGLSGSFWLRAIGWYAVALADLCELCPEEALYRDTLAELLSDVSRYADPETGMYAQVADCPEREGNYPETSGSSMLAYAMLKAARLGVLGEEYAAKGKKTFDGIVNKYLSGCGDSLRLGGICLSAGLGPKNNRRRDGSFAYYISEPVVENDAKGVAPFLLCYTELLRLTRQ